jgi:chromosome segregation ATPase
VKDKTSRSTLAVKKTDELEKKCALYREKALQYQQQVESLSKELDVTKQERHNLFSEMENLKEDFVTCAEEVTAYRNWSEEVKEHNRQYEETIKDISAMYQDDLRELSERAALSQKYKIKWKCLEEQNHQLREELEFVTSLVSEMSEEMDYLIFMMSHCGDEVQTGYFVEESTFDKPAVSLETPLLEAALQLAQCDSPGPEQVFQEIEKCIELAKEHDKTSLFQNMLVGLEQEYQFTLSHVTLSWDQDKQRNEEYVVEVNNLRQQYQVAIANADNQISKLQHEKSALSDDFSCKIAQVVEESRRLKEDINVASQTLNEKQQSLAVMERRVVDLSQQLDLSKKAHMTQTQRNETLLLQLNAVSEQNSDLITQIDELSKKSASLQETLSSCRQELDHWRVVAQSNEEYTLEIASDYQRDIFRLMYERDQAVTYKSKYEAQLERVQSLEFLVSEQEALLADLSSCSHDLFDLNHRSSNEELPLQPASNVYSEVPFEMLESEKDVSWWLQVTLNYTRVNQQLQTIHTDLIAQELFSQADEVIVGLNSQIHWLQSSMTTLRDDSKDRLEIASKEIEQLGLQLDLSTKELERKGSTIAELTATLSMYEKANVEVSQKCEDLQGHLHLLVTEREQSKLAKESLLRQLETTQAHEEDNKKRMRFLEEEIQEWKDVADKNEKSAVQLVQQSNAEMQRLWKGKEAASQYKSKLEKAIQERDAFAKSLDERDVRLNELSIYCDELVWLAQHRLPEPIETPGAHGFECVELLFSDYDMAQGLVDSLKELSVDASCETLHNEINYVMEVDRSRYAAQLNANKKLFEYKQHIYHLNDALEQANQLQLSRSNDSRVEQLSIDLENSHVVLREKEHKLEELEGRLVMDAKKHDNDRQQLLQSLEASRNENANILKDMER